MTEWFVVSLNHPRASKQITADNALEAVVRWFAQIGMEVAPAALELRDRMNPAGFAVWRADALGEAPMLVRERCT